MNIIGHLLFEYRKLYKITQQTLVNDLSDYSDHFHAFNTVTLSRWENGTTSPSLKRKKVLLQFFNSKQSLHSEVMSNLMKTQYKKMYEPLTKVFRHNYQNLIGNLPEFQIEKHSIYDLKISSTKDEHFEHIIDIEMATNAKNYYQLSYNTLMKLCSHQSSFCLIAERKKQHLGHFVMLKLKTEVARDIAYGKKSEFNITDNDICAELESGTYFIHALYGRSPKIAAELNVKAYLYLFENIDYIDNIMIFSTRTDGVLLTKDYGIKTVANGKNIAFGFQWHGMLSPVEDIIFSDTIIKLVF